MKIGEVSELSGVSARMLRHYDELGLVVPSARSSAGYREYSPIDLRRLFQVESLRSLGLSLKEIGTLDDGDSPPSLLVGRLLARTRARIERERELLRRLECVEDAGPGDWEAVLDVVVLLRELSSSLPGRRQRAALTAGVAAMSPAALVDALVAETEQNVIGALRWALVRMGPDAVPVLIAAVGRVGPDRRVTVLETLGEIPGDSSTAGLRQLLSDENARVRTRAAILLAVREPDAAVRDVLIEAVCDGIDDVDAAETLGVLDDPGTITALGRRATAGTPQVRARIAQALGEFPDQAAAPLLEVLARDPDQATSLTARRLLAAE